MNNKIALVSGANRGIGLAISTGLARKGVHVLMGCRDLAKGQSACEVLKAEGLEVTPVQLDTTDDNSVANLASLISETYGQLDMLINNAGISLDFVPDLTPSQRMTQTMEVNVVGTIRLTEAMTPLLAKSSHARIVNVSSELASFGLRTTPDWIYKDVKLPVYAATKAAVNALTLSYAEQLGEQGIKINAICPGLTATEATNFQGRPVEDAAVIAIDLALSEDNTRTATFENDAGIIPW